MKKNILCVFLVSILFAGFSFSLNAGAEDLQDGWKIDKELKYHLAYLPEKEPEEGDFEEPLPVGYTEDYMPDIANINLAGIIGLGFPLPSVEKAEDYNLYLKIYNFPECFEVEKSVLFGLNYYLLDKIKDGDFIYDFAADPHNVAVKKAFIEKSDKIFTEENSFPPLKVSSEEQDNFNEDIIFYSLYVNPAEEKSFDTSDENARWSAEGVLAFHKELIKTYKENLWSASGAESDKYYYFLKFHENSKDTFSVIKLQKEPFVFDNWRDMPMPADPGHMFLSGLLLIDGRDYKINRAICPSEVMVESTEFFENYEEIKGNVFEVGSVVRI